MEGLFFYAMQNGKHFYFITKKTSPLEKLGGTKK